MAEPNEFGMKNLGILQVESEAFETCHELGHQLMNEIDLWAAEKCFLEGRTVVTPEDVIKSAQHAFVRAYERVEKRYKQSQI